MAARLSAADKARNVLQHVYLYGVCSDSHADFLSLRDGLRAHKPKVRHADVDRWHVVPHEESGGTAEVRAPQPPTRPLAPPVFDDDDCIVTMEAKIKDAARTAPEGPMWSAARLDLSSVLEWLPEKHPMLPRMLKADDALSDWLSVYRWAHALAWFWGVDAEAYAAHIVRAL